MKHASTLILLLLFSSCGAQFRALNPQELARAAEFAKNATDPQSVLEPSTEPPAMTDLPTSSKVPVSAGSPMEGRNSSIQPDLEPVDGPVAGETLADRGDENDSDGSLSESNSAVGSSIGSNLNGPLATPPPVESADGDTFVPDPDLDDTGSTAPQMGYDPSTSIGSDPDFEGGDEASVGASIGSNLGKKGVSASKWELTPPDHHSGIVRFVIDAPHGAEVSYSLDRDDSRSADLSFVIEGIRPGRHTILVEVRDPTTNETKTLSHSWIQAPEGSNSQRTRN